MKRNWIIVSLIGIGLFILIVIILLTGKHTASPTKTDPFASISYTSAITGQQMTDNPSEETPMEGGIVPQPTANIEGIDQLANTLSSNQYGSIQIILKNFLLAHSGLRSVLAGIKDNQVTNLGNNTLRFTLVVVRPQASYQVTVKLDTTYDLIQNVSFTPVE